MTFEIEIAGVLERSSEPMANAYFILGGHALAANDYAAAAAYFVEFGEIARGAGLIALTLLAEGQGVITGAAVGSGNPGPTYWNRSMTNYGTQLARKRISGSTGWIPPGVSS